MTTIYVNGTKTPKEELYKFEIKSDLIKQVVSKKLKGGNTFESDHDSGMRSTI